jgi:hypothetical protein
MQVSVNNLIEQHHAALETAKKLAGM